MNIKGCVVINAANMPKLAEFYHKTFHLAFKQDGDKVRVLDLGGPLLLIQSAQGETASRTRFALFVDNVDDAFKKFQGAVKFSGSPAACDWGTRTVTGEDPEGNLIQFIQIKTVRPIDGCDISKAGKGAPRSPDPKP